jgi:hypothetical protein
VDESISIFIENFFMLKSVLHEYDLFTPGRNAEEDLMDSNESSQGMPNEKGDPVSKDPIANIRKLLKREPSEKTDSSPKPPGKKPTKSGMGIWRWAALVSFAINIIFLILIVLIGTRLFQFKTAAVEPLLEGVYSAVSQMDDVDVQTQVQVSSEVPVSFDVTVERDTVVTLSEPTQIEGAYLSIRSATFSVDAPSTIDLPVGTQLPITMNLSIAVNTTIPVELTVPVEVTLSESDLQPAIEAIQDLVGPYQQLLDDVPDCWQMLLWGGACPQ